MSTRRYDRNFQAYVWENSKGQLHREDGPALENDKEGRKEYYINGIPHRSDGPSHVWGDVVRYYVNGKLHRTDGPAVKYGDFIKFFIGRNEWWIDGVQLTELEYNEAIAALK